MRPVKSVNDTFTPALSPFRTLSFEGPLYPQLASINLEKVRAFSANYSPSMHYIFSLSIANNIFCIFGYNKLLENYMVEKGICLYLSRRGYFGKPQKYFDIRMEKML